MTHIAKKSLKGINSYRYFYFLGAGLLILLSLINLASSHLFFGKGILIDYLGRTISNFIYLIPVFPLPEVFQDIFNLLIILIPMIAGILILILETRNHEPNILIYFGFLLYIPQILLFIDLFLPQFPQGFPSERIETISSQTFVIFDRYLVIEPNLTIAILNWFIASIPAILILTGSIFYYSSNFKQNKNEKEQISLINYKNYYYSAGILTFLLLLNWERFLRIFLIQNDENYIFNLILSSLGDNIILFPLVFSVILMIVTFKDFNKNILIISGLILGFIPLVLFFDVFNRYLLNTGFNETNFFLYIVPQLYYSIIISTPGLLVLFGFKLQKADVNKIDLKIESIDKTSSYNTNKLKTDSQYNTSTKSSQFQEHITNSQLSVENQQEILKIHSQKAELNTNVTPQPHQEFTVSNSFQTTQKDNKLPGFDEKNCKHEDRPHIHLCFICGRKCCYQCAIEHAIKEKTTSYTSQDQTINKEFQIFCPNCFIDYSEEKISGLAYKPEYNSNESGFFAKIVKLIAGLVTLTIFLSEVLNLGIYVVYPLLILMILLFIFYSLFKIQNSLSGNRKQDPRIKQIRELANRFE